jgi:cation diffusion facilitator family transporter
MRLVTPESISFGPALVVAVIGLVVNLASALVLGHGHEHSPRDQGHDHDHDHEHEHDHDHEHEHEHGQAHGNDHPHHGEDLNLKSAYVHVLADAFTSVLAIAALATGLWLGWTWMDPVMGIVGAGVILWWAKGLIADSARVLLDREMDNPVVHHIRKAIETDGDAEIADLHVWRVGRASHAAVVTVVAQNPLAPDAYRARLAGVSSLTHVSVEVNRCPHRDCP